MPWRMVAAAAPAMMTARLRIGADVRGIETVEQTPRAFIINEVGQVPRATG